MALFMLNICQYHDCGIEFPQLDDLILHIQDTHLDAVLTHNAMLNPPYSIALSYIIRYTTAWTREVHPPQQRRAKEQQQQPPAPAKPKSSALECFVDEDFISHSEDSNDSWTTMEEYSSEFIFRYGTKMKTTPQASARAHVGGAVIEKPFACPVPGCKKRYKNVNGIKYHSKNGHKKDGKVNKAYKCHCGKEYTIAQGLKNHITSKHPKYQLNSSSSTTRVTSGRDTVKPLRIMRNAMDDLLVTASVEPNKFIRIQNPVARQDYVPRYTIGNMTIVNRNSDARLSPISSPALL